jgi:hypothetical protein
MKLFAIVVLAGMLAGTLFAQSANVIELEAADAARARKAWDALQKAQAEWDDLRDQIGNKYTLTKQDDAHCAGITLKDKYYGCPMKGFENGFEFSKDFKFIVPKMPPATSINTFTFPAGGSIQ